MPFLRGLGMTASMIVALGPQNAYLLKHGLTRSRAVFGVAALYVTIDACLILLGALGVGTIIAGTPLLKMAASLIAIGFFAIYGIVSIRNGLRSRVTDLEGAPPPMNYTAAILVSILNPAVLFDTIVIIGGMAGQYSELHDRLVFSAGATAASLSWFAFLAFTSYHAGRFITGPKVWRTLDIAIGALMLALAYAIWATSSAELNPFLRDMPAWLGLT